LVYSFQIIHYICTVVKPTDESHTPQKNYVSLHCHGCGYDTSKILRLLSYRLGGIAVGRVRVAC